MVKPSRRDLLRTASATPLFTSVPALSKTGGTEDDPSRSVPGRGHDISVANNSDDDHQVTVAIRNPSGRTVLREEYPLEGLNADGEVQVEDAVIEDDLPVPGSGRHEVVAALEGGASDSLTWGIPDGGIREWMSLRVTVDHDHGVSVFAVEA